MSRFNISIVNKTIKLINKLRLAILPTIINLLWMVTIWQIQSMKYQNKWKVIELKSGVMMRWMEHCSSCRDYHLLMKLSHLLVNKLSYLLHFVDYMIVDKHLNLMYLHIDLEVMILLICLHNNIVIVEVEFMDCKKIHIFILQWNQPMFTCLSN